MAQLTPTSLHGFPVVAARRHRDGSLVLLVRKPNDEWVVASWSAGPSWDSGTYFDALDERAAVRCFWAR